MTNHPYLAKLALLIMFDYILPVSNITGVIQPEIHGFFEFLFHPCQVILQLVAINIHFCCTCTTSELCRSQMIGITYEIIVYNIKKSKHHDYKIRTLDRKNMPVLIKSACLPFHLQTQTLFMRLVCMVLTVLRLWLKFFCFNI